MPSLPDRRSLEKVGLGLALLGAAWFAITAELSGGRALLLAGPFAGTVVAVLAAGRLPQRARRSVLWFVTVSPVLAALINRQPLLGDGPLAYANASAVLYVLAATAGIVLAISLGASTGRSVAAVVSVVWLLAPWALVAFTAGFVGVGIAVVTGLHGRFRAATFVRWSGLVIVLLFAAVTLAGVTYEPGPRTSPMHRVIDTSMGELRVVLWNEATEMIAAEPLTGVGPGRFREVSPTAADRDDAWWAHNEFLHIAAESGVPGGVLLLALVVWCLAWLWPAAADPRAVTVFAAVLGVSLNATIDYVWHFPAIPLGLGLLVGVVPGLRTLGPEPGLPLRQSTRTVLVATVTLCLVLVLPLGPLNPVHTSVNGAESSTDHDALVFTSPGIARSLDPPEPLYRALAATQTMTLELWVATADRSQDGPARIVSSSPGIAHRNLTLGQSGDRLIVRLRTSATDWNAVEAEVEVPDVFRTDALQHVAIITDLRTTEVFVDGQRRWSGPGPGGSLDNWNHTYPLLIGNEDSGDRPWLGTLQGFTFHDRVLRPEELASAFREGPPTSDTRAREGTAPVARYTFTEGTLRKVPDRSPRALAGDLAVPERFTTPPSSFAATFASVGDRPAVRAVGHLLAFAVWAGGLVALSRRPVRRGLIVAALPIGGAAIATGASLIRYVEGRSPSWLDVAAALLGSLAAALVVTTLQDDRSPSPPLD